MYTRVKKVLQHPNHNGVHIVWSFATLKIIIQLSHMLKNKNILHLKSNAQKFIEDFNNDRTAMIS